jgi:hypothetical protein
MENKTKQKKKKDRAQETNRSQNKPLPLPRHLIILEYRVLSLAVQESSTVLV